MSKKKKFLEGVILYVGLCAIIYLIIGLGMMENKKFNLNNEQQIQGDKFFSDLRKVANYAHDILDRAFIFKEFGQDEFDEAWAKANMIPITNNMGFSDIVFVQITRANDAVEILNS